MARDGSGTYSLYTPGNPVVTGTTISSSAFNNTLNDIASALTLSIASDGQTPITANIPFGGNKITGLAAGTTTGDAIAFGQSGANLAAITFSGTHTFSSGNLISGTYTPTATSISNVSSSSMATCFYLQVGGVATVGGFFQVTPTAAGSTQIQLTVPVATTFADSGQASGSAISTNADVVARIASAVTGRFAVEFTAPSGSAISFWFQAIYRVI